MNRATQPAVVHTIVHAGGSLAINAATAAHLVSVRLIESTETGETTARFHIVEPSGWEEIDAAIAAHPLLNIVPSEDLKSEITALLGKVEAVSGCQFLIAWTRANGCGIVVVDGNFDREVFKAVQREAVVAGRELRKMLVYCETATYVGNSIAVAQFSELPGALTNRKPRPNDSEMRGTDGEKLSAEQHATVIAALRHYQACGLGVPANRSEAIHDIATNGGEVISLDEDGIDALVEQLQFDPTRATRTEGAIALPKRLSLGHIKGAASALTYQLFGTVTDKQKEIGILRKGIFTWLTALREREVLGLDHRA